MFRIRGRLLQDPACWRRVQLVCAVLAIASGTAATAWAQRSAPSEPSRPVVPMPDQEIQRTPTARPPRVPPQPATPDVTTPPPQISETSYRPSRFLLASVPNMFGDLPGPSFQVLYNKFLLGGANGMADLPLAGSVRRMKITENNKALPMDRVYVAYNHFHNAMAGQNDPLQSLPGNGQPTGTVLRSPVDRYMIGCEKTFGCELWSVDLRMPFSNGPRFDDTAAGFGVFGDEVGNLNVAVKRILWAYEDHAVTLGLGIDTPTGDNVTGIAQGVPFTVHNDAVYLQPFIGGVGTLNECLFYHGFLQFDIAANGNRIDVDGVEVGDLCEQNLMHVDVAVGNWFYRNPNARYLTGLAGMVEFHYSTTIQDSDQLEVGDVFDPPIITTFPVNFLFDSRYNRLDLTNLTVGIHMEIAGCTTLRVGTALPLSDWPDRSFDGELMIQLNRYF